MTRRLRALVALFGIAALLATAAGAATYPIPPFNFAHPGTPHPDDDPVGDPLLSTASGDDDRPLVVVLGRFSDVTDPAGATSASIQTMFFGGFPSVTDFFNANSFGRFTVSPAAETEGTANDGVIEVDLGLRPAFNAMTEAQRGRLIVDKAAAFMNFAPFDQDSNGSVDARELGIFHVFEAQPVPGDTNDCGATRNVGAGAAHNGKNLTNRGYSSGTTLTNMITHIHELSHQMLGHNDGSYQSGAFDVTGPTCPPPGVPFAPLFHYNAWHKLHFGWITPTVVSKDGYYTVARWDTSGQAYLLYDPDRGTNDYFLVENRRVTAGTYERDAGDTGLVIWRVDETRFQMAPPNHMVIIRPDGVLPTGPYGGSNTDAWNAADSVTPQRAMTAAWGDGAPSKLAVRAIPGAGDPMRVYFDVRGPGVLVDTYSLFTSTPPDIPLGEPGSITVPVMNTGEASGTFEFTAGSLPAGWTASVDTETLGAGASTNAQFTVTPPLTASTGLYTLQAVGNEHDGQLGDLEQPVHGQRRAAADDARVLRRSDCRLPRSRAADGHADGRHQRRGDRRQDGRLHGRQPVGERADGRGGHRLDVDRPEPDAGHRVALGVVHRRRDLQAELGHGVVRDHASGDDDDLHGPDRDPARSIGSHAQRAAARGGDGGAGPVRTDDHALAGRPELHGYGRRGGQRDLHADVHGRSRVTAAHGGVRGRHVLRAVVRHGQDGNRVLVPEDRRLRPR